jgi:hypothetical protein
MGKVYALGGNTIMKHREIPSTREIVRLTFIGALTLFFIAEVVLAQDAPGRGLFTCAS